MAVGTSVNAQVLLDGYNLHQFARSFQVNPQADILDTSVLGTTSRTKVKGLTHAAASGEFFIDDTLASGSFDLLTSKYNATPGVITFAPQGFALGGRTVQLYGNEVSFDVKAIVDGLEMITLNVESAEDAVDFGVSLHSLSSETSLPVTGTSVDNAAATSNGGVGVLHVSAIAGASPNVVYKIQHSVDGSTWVDLISFTAVTAIGGQRVEVAAGTTIRRYLRITATEGGTTSSVTGAVSFARR